jgi:RNA-directed DNA polymerase
VSQGRWVSQVQAKLHCWAAADPDRRFDDLFNLVHHPATLAEAWARVARNRGARSAGSDGVTVAWIEAEVGVPAFLDDLRHRLREGSFHPQPVRERKIPKPGGGGKVRRLGIPTVAAKCDRSQCVVRFSADHPSVPRVVRLPGDGVVLQAARRPVGVRL